MTPSSHLGDHLVPAPPRSGPRFPALDTLRLVGALCVLTTHVAFWSGDYTRHGVWGTLLARLDVGVAIFFVLSGFLLARPWIMAGLDAAPRPDPPSYLRRRWWRIAPLYLLTVALALALVEDNRGLGWGERVSTVLMLDTVTSTSFPAGLTHMWSLAVEVSFYLLLPLLMLLLLGRTGRGPTSTRRIWTGLLAMTVVSVWWHLDGAARVGSSTGGSPTQWLPAFLTWFAIGIALALLQVLLVRGRSPRAAGAVHALAHQPGACWALAAGLLLASATPVAGPAMFAAPTPAQSLTKHLLYAAVALLVVLPSILGRREHSRYDTVLSATPLRRLGWISYGVFCLHLPVLHLVMWATGWELFAGRGLQIFVVTVLLSLLAAEAAYRFVELPALALGRRPSRFTRNRGTRTGPSAADDDASASAASAGTQR